MGAQIGGMTMIVDFYPTLDYCEDEGMGAGATLFTVSKDKDKILKELKLNIRVAKRVCSYYGIDFASFCDSVDRNEKDHPSYHVRLGMPAGMLRPTSEGDK